MDQAKDKKVNKKVGADGLSKKERRALKIQAVGVKDNAPKLNQPDTKSDTIVDQKVNNTVLIVPENTSGSNNSNKPVGSEVSSKSELRAQRRALQETQRQTKLNTKQEQPKEKSDKPKEKPTNLPVVKASSPKKETVKHDKSHKHKVLLFSHLYSDKLNNVSNLKNVHPEFLKLGSQYASKTILGSNARCLAILSALKKFILDFITPPKQELCRSLDSTLQVCISHVNACRPPAVSMTNALRRFKLHLTQIDTNLSDNEKKGRLLECIETYINDEIAKAGEAISMQVYTKISNGDVILTFGCSSLISKILLDAYREGKKFKVIVVDARPMLEGKEMLRKLVCAGIHCTYVLINAASFVMSRVSKVLLGAHALLANGYVMSRTGTAQIALIANAYKKPVLVCCETYKFCERVQTDSFVYNEIGNPEKLVQIDTLADSSPLTNWQNSNYLTPINLMYDVTPPDLVTAVVTELAFLPCTSVPVILRIRPTEIVV